MIDARTLATALGGHWYGRYGVAPCPVCQPDRRKDQTALTISDGEGGRLLTHCKRSACAFGDILDAARGLGDAGSMDDFREPPGIRPKPGPACSTDAVLRLWNATVPATGTLAHAYLRSRGIDHPPPETLRFHPACWHGPSARPWPALVAKVSGGRAPAVHRTWLAADGAGKAPVSPQKAMLGPTAGGAVRLSTTGTRLIVAEGIETAMSLLSDTSAGHASVWAALSTSGLRGLRLPAVAGHLTIACDGDDAGRAAAQALADRAHVAGWTVGILDPGDGLDFNDLVRKARTT